MIFSLNYDGTHNNYRNTCPQDENCLKCSEKISNDVFPEIEARLISPWE